MASSSPFSFVRRRDCLIGWIILFVLHRIRLDKRYFLCAALSSSLPFVHEPLKSIPQEEEIAYSSSSFDLKELMLPRNVTVRLFQRNYGDVLLQIYQGAAVPPVVRDAASLHRADRLLALLQERTWDMEMALSHVALPKEALSFSTMTQLLHVTTLSIEEQTLLLLQIKAELRSSRPIHVRQHVRILYVDDHICVVHKPSGVLSVPGPRRNPSVCAAVYDLLRPAAVESMDQMVVHRLDMDTSGILVFALSKIALQQLHDDFRHRRVVKYYQALLRGHVRTDGAAEWEVDVDLERDPHRPPFMRIAQRAGATHNTTDDRKNSNKRQAKFFHEAPKPSVTDVTILSYEYRRHPTSAGALAELPVTRVQFRPHTGRTHQLRVHAASVLGHAIVGDDIYGDPSHERMDDAETPLCLHAHRLCMNHPISGAPMIFECQPHF